MGLAGGPGPGRRAAGRIHGRSDRPGAARPATCWSSTSAAPAAPTRSAARRWNASAAGRYRTCSNSARCEIGPARAGFTSEESVRDIEALRVAGGYEKLVLYGTSYGTKVALEYAQQYPQHVESLVLDSVVPVDGPEPFAIPSFRALPGVLRELCANRACAGITGESRRRPRRAQRPPAPPRAQRLGVRRQRPPPRGHARRDGAAAHDRGRRRQPRAAGAAAGGRALGAERGPRPAAAPARPLRGPDPDAAPRTPGRKHRRTSTKPCSPPPPARRPRSRGRAAPPRRPGWPKRTPSSRPSRQLLLPLRRGHGLRRRACWKRARRGPTPRRRPRPKGSSRTSPR